MKKNLGTVSLNQKGFKLSALTLVIAATLPVKTVFAEEIKELATSSASAEAEQSYKVDRSTSEKYTQELVNTPKTITIISESVMKDRNVDSLRDALRSVPGISMAAGEGGAPTGDSMSIRGFNASNNVMIDGVRDIAGYNRDTYNVEAIEVAKGPGSAIYGRGAAGGVVNLETKTAKLDDFADVSLRVGSEGDYRGQVDGNVTVGETSAVRVNVLVDDGETAGRDNVERATNAIALGFTHGLGTDSRLSINADYQKQDNMPDYGIPWVSNYSNRDDRVIADNLAAYEGGTPPVDFSNFYGNVYRDFEDIEGSSITVKYEKDITATTKLRVLGRTGSIERQSIINAPRFTSTTDDTTGITTYGADEEIGLGGEKTRDTKNSMSVVQFDLIGQYDLGGMTHDIVAGAEFAKEKFERWNYTATVTDNLQTINTDMYNPDNFVAYTGKYERTDKSNEATGTTTAFYAFDTVTINPEWQVSAGLRYDMFDTEYFYDLDGADPSLKVETDEGFVSWNFGLVYKPAENGSIYFGAGNAFTSSAEDVTASTGTNLDPEETMSYEIGTKWAFYNNDLLLSAALFHSEKINALTEDPDFAGEDILDGEQSVTGLELSVVGQVNEDFSVTAAYTYQQSEVTSASGADAVQIGYELPRTPENSASLWGHYTITEKFAAGLGAEYVGDRYNSSDPGGRELADGYVIFDAMVSYQVTDKFLVQANGENLTGEEYVDQLGGGHFVPGDGRYFSINASYSF
ncbi:TonB-dependent siderophore receptor [Colwellia sp. E2M01]|uniref:TonB-dependent receptor n=1 Tax=Colwellia sp. E2M01 TaxID=2841561 RepID=UPI001C08DF04|nr:TonB-dependent siderophore receptor [Colwellia sp. E2M01]MBU2871690.1 TonB-dependent siderophore receptor [Colwellia sp. E2M01]